MKGLPALLPVLVFLVYGCSLRNSFVFDDHTTVEESRLLSSWKNLPVLAGRDYFRASGEDTYRPVVTAGYFLDRALYGNAPAGWHATNVLFHAANVLLLFYLLLRITGQAVPAFLTAALFAVFPPNGEPVNAISFREDLLVVFFGLVSFHFYLCFTADHPHPPPPPSRGRAGVRGVFLGLSAIAYLLAMLSKENGVILPFLFLVYEWVFSSGETRLNRKQAAIPALVYLAPVVVFVLLRFCVFRNPAAGPIPFIGGGFLTAFFFTPVIALRYLTKIVIPFPLLVEYPSIVPSDIDFTRCASAWFLLALFVAAVLFARRRNRFFAFGSAWFLLAFLPVSNLVPLVNHVADRYLYLPSVGLCIALVGLIFGLSFPRIVSGNPSRLGPGFPTDTFGNDKPRYVVIGMIVAFWGILSALRVADWRTDETLWKRNLVFYPGSARAWTNLGVYYETRGQYRLAVDSLSEALRISPDCREALYNRGLAYRAAQRYQEAVADFSRLLKINPRDAEVLNDRGIAYAGGGNPAAAIADFTAAIKADPGLTKAYRNLEIAQQCLNAGGR